MRLAIHQPNYIPWCGYFSKISFCEKFIFLDDVIISTGPSYVNRVKVNSNNGVRWLSVPTHRNKNEEIQDVNFANKKWQFKHLNILKENYYHSPFFEEIYQIIEPLYKNPGEKISLFNIKMIKKITNYLEIQCTFFNSSELPSFGRRDDLHISLAKELNADTYISGEGGINYQDPERFQKSGIELLVKKYEPIRYPQLHGDFIPGLSILDALFNLGKEASNVLGYRDK